MSAFHVFVEGATDGSAAGLSQLADAIAKHYGLPAADLLARLQKGRFRVKGNIDRATAETYARDLERLGARCAIEEANAANAQKTPLPFPAVKPLPASAPPKPSTPPPTGGFQSGLSAAFSGETPAADLGALGKTSSQFSLSTVDGEDDGAGAPPASAFEPAGMGIPASIGPAPEKPTSGKVPKAAKPKDEPVDLFAPPEMQGEEFKVDLASDEKDPRGRVSEAAAEPPARPSSQKIPTTPASQKLPTTRASQPSIPTQNAPVDVVAPSTSKFGPLGDTRVRFAAGVFLAVLLGFVPAHFIAKMREQSASAEIDNKVIKAQQQAETADLWDALDRLRADQLDRKKSEHRNAAMIGFALWALVGGGLAFVWFKKIPWDD
jgi:hypothetical protein